MASAATDRRWPVPLTTITYVGLPIYAVAAGFSIWRIVRDHSALAAALAIVAIGLFTATLVRAARIEVPSHRRPGALLAVLAVLAAALSPLGGPSIMYLMTVGALAAIFLAPRWAILSVATVTVAVAIIDLSGASTAQGTMTDSVVALVVGLFAFGLTRLAESNRELSVARLEVARLAVAEERLRFARDLHDLLGHTLTVIRVKSELAGRLVPSDPEGATKEMVEIDTVAREALAEVRQAVTGYRRTTLSTELANARAMLAGAAIAADVPECSPQLPSAVDQALGWVVREAVSNVVRHSGAKHCRVTVAVRGEAVRLAVTDDGQGSADTSGGHGLTGMRERLAEVGGALEPNQPSHTGYHLSAVVPISS